MPLLDRLFQGRPRYELIPFHRDSPYFEGAVNVYAKTWNRPWGDSFSFFLRYARDFPDYFGFVAVLPDRATVVGMGFGNRSLPGHWWHDKIAEQIGEDHPMLQDAWALTELAVLPGYRGHGVGGELHDRLLAAQPCPRTLLSTEVSNMSARRFYERRGWQYLHPGFSFGYGNPPYLIMYRVAIRSTENPDR